MAVKKRNRKRAATTKQRAVQPWSTRPPRLTPRETEVLTLIVQGYKTTEIAKLLKCSPSTVNTHRTTIYNKLGIRGLAGLVRYALRERLIDV
jgi:DNA-binding NarL/FixJ family response regulator